MFNKRKYGNYSPDIYNNSNIYYQQNNYNILQHPNLNKRRINYRPVKVGYNFNVYQKFNNYNYNVNDII